MKTKKSALALLFDVFEIRAQIERILEEIADSNGIEREAVLQAVALDALMEHLLKEFDVFFTDKELARLAKAFSGPVGKSLGVKLPIFSEKLNRIADAYVEEKLTGYFESLNAGSGDEKGGNGKGGNGNPLA